MLFSSMERIGQVHLFAKGMGLVAPQIGVGRATAAVHRSPREGGGRACGHNSPAPPAGPSRFWIAATAATPQAARPHPSPLVRGARPHLHARQAPYSAADAGHRLVRHLLGHHLGG